MSSPESSHRQRMSRSAVATQACEVCRTRKSKCDEQRPKCGLCQRLNLECVYREPKPTKKDKTLLQIIEALQRLEHKVDRIAATSSGAASSQMIESPSLQFVTSSSQSRIGSSIDSTSHSPIDPLSLNAAFVAPKVFPSKSPNAIRRAHNHLSHADRIFTWPAIQKMLTSSGGKCAEELHHLLGEGTAYLVAREQEKHRNPLTCENGLRSVPVRSSLIVEANIGIPVIFPDLTQSIMQQYTDVYFNTFNMLYPILDYDEFTKNIVQLVLNRGFGESCISSVTALVVFALGKLAVQGVFGNPVPGTQRGMRGGTSHVPPALDLFNEARRRMGFIELQCNLETTQMLLLMAVYYESAQRHIDCWRTTMMASQALLIVLRTQHVDWSSYHGDLIRRAFWVCHVLESWLRIDLDLPESGISDFCDAIALPLFTTSKDQVTPTTPGPGHYQFNFLSMIAIRRTIDRVHKEIYDTNGAETKHNFGAPPMLVVQELSRQLDDWRRSLPTILQWDDADRTSYLCYQSPDDTNPIRAEFTNDTLFAPKASSIDKVVVSPLIGLKGFASESDINASSSSTQKQKQDSVSRSSGGITMIETYNADIVAAQLRCRFYYCKVMLYRPFLYKALHYPSELSTNECVCVADCINSCLLWPIAMSPPKDKKRLIPNVYVWTQSFMIILLMLRAAMESDVVRRICEDETVGENGDQLRASVRNMLAWMADMAVVDGIADWNWSILEPLFGDFLGAD